MEDCDDGNFDDDDECPGSCQPAYCGDGFRQVGVEECDDGNNIDNDGCTNDCIALCGNDCFSDAGCFTPGGKCIKFSCRAGNDGPNWCDSCGGWQEITYNQWLNQGYCSDLIQTYRNNYGTATRCGQAASCCNTPGSCGGGDNAWHFHDGVNNRYVGPCLGCQNDVNCTYWNGTDNSAYTRISACER
jgi:cysteine-rich repeat protein